MTIVALLLSLSYLLYRALSRPTGQSRVQVRRGALEAIVEATGQVRPVREARLSLQTSGLLMRAYVKVGDEVAAGDVLLEVESSALEQRLNEARLNLEIQQLQLAQLEAGASAEDLAIAQANLASAEARLEQVRAHPTEQELTAAKAALDKAEMALRLAQAEYDRVKWMPEVAIARAQLSKAQKGASAEQIAIAERQVALAEEGLNAAERQLREARLVAPFTGTVLALEAREGENVYAGNALLHLADLHTLEITAQIDELDIAAVAVGQLVAIRLDAFPGQTLSGKLQRLAPGATPQRGSTTYEAIIAFDPGDLPVRPSMAANLTITTKKKEDVLLVPNRAIQTLGRRKVVKRIEGGSVRQVEITVGLSNQSETEVISGLNEGDVLIIE